MIVGYARDGEEVDKDWLLQKGFNLNENRDIRKKYDRNSNTGEEKDSYKYVLDFVGFLTNKNNDVFCVFPKNYRVEDLEKDATELFKVISKHRQKRPELYIGDKYSQKLKSNYPFAAFFGIYEYFSKYGLYFDDKVHIKPNSGGRVNWKETIRLSNKYLSNGKISFFPIYYEKKYYFSVLLTECMVFAIDYTIDKFNIFIKLSKTESKLPEVDLTGMKEVIVENLFALRQQTFKDSLIELIDHLINFYTNLNEGGNCYFKHYSFASIWEDMVMNYLRLNYSEIKDDKIVFDEQNLKRMNFYKPSFRPNIANKNHYFTPDHYCVDGDTQLIFDAKYYTSISGMDYKQIAYYLFLNEYRENINDQPIFSNTYSALILPSEKRHSKIHFKMKPQFNKSNQNLVISEEYLDVKEAIKVYL